MRKLTSKDFGPPPALMSLKQIFAPDLYSRYEKFPLIKRDTRLLMTGICFVNNLRTRLAAYGYKAEMFLLDIFGNLHSLQAMSQGLFRFDDPSYIETLHNLIVQVDDHCEFEHLNGLPWLNYKTKEDLEGLIAKVANRDSWVADVYFFNFGGLECWYDNLYGIYSSRVTRKDFAEKRYTLHTWGMDETRECLRKIEERLWELNPAAKIIYSVTPQPPAATFQKKHLHEVFWEHMSILRLAIDERVDRELRFYFPSLEMTLFPSNAVRWAVDGRHVTSHTRHDVFNQFRELYITDFTEELPTRIIKETTLYYRHLARRIESQIENGDTANLRDTIDHMMEYIFNNPVGMDIAPEVDVIFAKTAEALFVTGQFDKLGSFAQKLHEKGLYLSANTNLEIWDISYLWNLVRETQAVESQLGDVIRNLYLEYNKLSGEGTGDGYEKWLIFIQETKNSLPPGNCHRIRLVSGAYYHAALLAGVESVERGEFLKSALETNQYHRAARKLLMESAVV